MRGKSHSQILYSLITLLFIFLIFVGNKSFTVLGYELDVLTVIIIGVVILLIDRFITKLSVKDTDKSSFSSLKIEQFWMLFAALLLMAIIIDIYTGYHLKTIIEQNLVNIVDNKYLYVAAGASIVYMVVFNGGKGEGFIFFIANFTLMISLMLIFYGPNIDVVYGMFEGILESIGMAP